MGTVTGCASKGNNMAATEGLAFGGWRLGMSPYGSYTCRLARIRFLFRRFTPTFEYVDGVTSTLESSERSRRPLPMQGSVSSV